jgi:hypothetical protein
MDNLKFAGLIAMTIVGLFLFIANFYLMIESGLAGNWRMSIVHAGYLFISWAVSLKANKKNAASD